MKLLDKVYWFAMMAIAIYVVAMTGFIMVTKL
jgi:hypothetical protein